MAEEEIRACLSTYPLMFSRVLISGYRVGVLLKKTALVCGAGGLGVLVAEILARTGIGKIIIVDKDVVGEENFNRLGFSREDIGRPKAEALKRRLLALRNAPNVPRRFWLEVEAHQADVLEMKGLWKLVSRSDVVFTCFDNLEARLEVNRQAVRLGKPLFDAGTSRDGLRGTIRTVIPGRTPCLRCYYPPGSLLNLGETLGFACDASLATTMAIVASLQADQAFKYLLGYGKIAPLIRVSLEEEVRVTPEYNVARRPDCEDCGSL
ncbi:hypothetical protein DRO33_05420 [Candidatus Bathyarchaeota archaeon]|nr:MAG: hypothetical protein DRO33_05420 [Candidatus Bathyarchaeota archaeon]